MSSLVFLIAMLTSSSCFAAQPLLQYAWRNQVSDSQLIIMDDGTVIHHERQMYELSKVPEIKLSEVKIEKIKRLIAEIATSKVDPATVDTDLGSMTGTLEVSTEKGLVIVEGVIRDIHDMYRAKLLKSRSEKIDELKEIIFQYTNLDMDT